MLLDPYPDFVPSEYRVKWATDAWEVREAYALRRAVFCTEQAVYASDDRDATDDDAQLLVATACMCGVAQQVVGTVRIHEQEPRIWCGSRLAVHAAFRRHGGLGAALIRLAVSSAHALGCETFVAHVQMQNVPLFRRLHWRPLGEETLCERPHMRMQAALDWYPPCNTPRIGFAVRATRTARAA